MKQEHKLVAELYRYLAPFINTEHDVYVSLDGQAAMTGVGKGTFSDSTVPDLWFTLLAATAPTLVEAKTIDANGRALLMQSQLQAWRSNGAGAHKPAFWAATNRAFDRFYFWSHAEFLPVLDKTTASRKHCHIVASKKPKGILECQRSRLAYPASGLATRSTGPPATCACRFPPRCALRRPVTSNVWHFSEGL